MAKDTWRVDTTYRPSFAVPSPPGCIGAVPLRWRLAEAGTADLLIGMLSRHSHREDRHAHFFSPRDERVLREVTTTLQSWHQP